MSSFGACVQNIAVFISNAGAAATCRFFVTALTGAGPSVGLSLQPPNSLALLRVPQYFSLFSPALVLSLYLTRCPPALCVSLSHSIT